MIGKRRGGVGDRWQSRVLRFGLWLTAVLLFWFILRTVSLAETWAVLRRLGWWQLMLLAVANGIVLLLMNGRWWLILLGQGHSVPYLALTSYRLAGASLSYITPGPQFGGEPLQVLLVERNYGVPRVTAVASIALDKTLELIVNFGFLLGGVVFIWQTELLGQVAGWQTAVLPILLLLFPLTLLISFWLDWRIFTRLVHLPRRCLRLARRSNHLQKIQQAIVDSEAQLTLFCRQQPRHLALAFFISLLAWTSLIAEFWLMLTLLGLHVSFLQMLVILTATRVALLLPLPGSLGTLEASQLLAITTLGFSPAAALSFSLLIRARDVVLVGLGLWIAKSSLATVLSS